MVQEWLQEELQGIENMGQNSLIDITTVEHGEIKVQVFVIRTV